MNLNALIKIGLAILFLVCLLDMPYGYYQLVRFTGMVGFGIIAYAAHLRGNKTYLVIWAVSALLINPIIKIPLGRELWNVIDLIWAVGLIVSLKLEK